MRADAFLSMYRVLEGLLEEKFAGEEKRGQSVIMAYLANAESEPVRARLNICREIRNLLTHSSDDGGAPLIQPSQAVLDDLYEIIKYVETPQPALSFATRAEKILRAGMNDRALEVMRRMEKHGYSHVPVMNGEKLIGVFSVETVFNYLLTDREIHADTRVREFGKLIALGERDGRYLTMDATASYLDVRREFENRSRRNNRLAAVFITSTGDKGGELLGMLTPWDVLGDTP